MDVDIAQCLQALNLGKTDWVLSLHNDSQSPATPVPRKPMSSSN